MNEEMFEPVFEPDAFGSALRNIRITLDGTAATFDLIPSIVLDRPAERRNLSIDPAVDKVLDDMLANARPIVEADRLMRIDFESLAAVVIQDEFIELHRVFDCGRDRLPMLRDGKTFYPFLRIVNSKWRQRLPDYQGGNDPKLEHFRILSMETHVDVLACLVGRRWLPNVELH